MSPSRPPLFGIFCCGVGGHAMAATQSLYACLTLLTSLATDDSLASQPWPGPGRGSRSRLAGPARVTSIPGPGPELGPEPDVTSPVSESEMKMQDGANSLADRALMASGRGRVVRTHHTSHTSPALSALSGSGCWELVTDRQGSMDPDI